MHKASKHANPFCAADLTT